MSEIQTERKTELLPERSTIARGLVLLPHPDDEAFMGATIGKLDKVGVDMYAVSVTDGRAGSKTISPDQLVPIRRREAQRAGEILGLKGYGVMDFPDGRLYQSEELVNKLAVVVRMTRPRLIFVPTEMDYHADHRILLEATRRALERAMSPDFITPGYNPTTELVALYTMDPQGLKTQRGQFAEAKIIIRVTEEEMERRLKGFSAHTSQLQEAPSEGVCGYVERSRREGIVRGVQANYPYGEGFNQVYGDYPLTQRNLLQELLGYEDVTVFAA